ncbi:hypothetical protein [Microbacterium sp. lyk4-40-TSB-66]|uniref:hypothetical protein n=1 Tax=Microbacterium sp. lyk4-40-TSB-66 TaxID=3040294 RepID=UPI00254F15F9|nr:hypothetical protein [Microbacterium sp. lyk4-40-TSB-66]
MTHPVDPPQTPDATAPEPTSPRSRRRAAIAIGSALALGGVALAIWAVAAAIPSSPDAQPAPAAPASVPATPTVASSAGASTPASAASTPPPASENAPVIAGFSVSPTVAECPDDRDSTVPLTFSWTSEGADRAWIGIATSDASVQPTAEVETTAEGYADLLYACSDADQVFTLTVQGAGGTLSRTIAIARDLG